ncbi:MAG TPA: TlpA disulfide reductase family protein [Methyloversatilis sp.]
MHPAANTWQRLGTAMLMCLSGALAQASELVVDAPSAAPHSDDPQLARLIETYAGRPLIINFWASWCEPCRDEMPALARAGARLAAQGVVVLTVAVADRETDAAKFMRDAKLALPLLHDRDQRTSRAWGARMLPYTVVLDRRHRILARAQGVIEWDDEAVVRQLQRLFE